MTEETAQRESLTARRRSRAAKALAQARKDAGILPGFMKHRKERVSGLLRFIKRFDLLITIGIVLLAAQRLFHWSSNFVFGMLICIFILKELVSWSFFFIRRSKKRAA